jgi:ribosomal protein L7Ae-like RNA K-turn-binding protein
MLIEERFQ